MEKFNSETENAAIHMSELNLNISGEGEKRKSIPWCAAVAIVTALAVLVSALWNPLISFIRRNRTASLISIEQQAFSDILDAVFYAYDLLAAEESSAVGVNCRTEFFVDEFALGYIQKEFPKLSYLDVVNDISIDFVYENDGTGVNLQAALLHDSIDLPQGQLYFDFDTRNLSIAIPSISKSYFNFDLMAYDDISIIPILLSCLPDSAAAKKYLNDVFSEFTALMSDEIVTVQTVSVDEFQQECVLHTARINYCELIRLISLALDDFVDLCGYDPAIDELVTSVQQMLEHILEKTSEKVQIIWKVYSDMDNRIIGRDISLTTGVHIANYLCVHDDDHIAVDLSMMDFDLCGRGVISDGLLEGTFELYSLDEKIAKLELDECLINNVNDGSFTGTLRITPTTDFLKDLTGIELGIPVTLDLEMDIGKQRSSLAIGCMDMIVIGFDLERVASDAISKPSGESINGADTDALYCWLSDADFGTLRRSFSDLGIPVMDTDFLE